MDGAQPAADEDTPQAVLAAWQQWYAETFPTRPPAVLPVPASDVQWSYEALLHHVEAGHAQAASPRHGAAVFRAARCAECHTGERAGPDLMALGQRQMKREILESIVYPSHRVAPDYATWKIETRNGRSQRGVIVAQDEGQLVLLNAAGQRETVDEKEISQRVQLPVSTMPAGLLDTLTLEEISDLLAYLGLLPTAMVAGQDQEKTTRSRRWRKRRAWATMSSPTRWPHRSSERWNISPGCPAADRSAIQRDHGQQAGRGTAEQHFVGIRHVGRGQPTIGKRNATPLGQFGQHGDADTRQNALAGREMKPSSWR